MITKNTMARVIVQALYQMPKLPAPDSPRVLRWERTRKPQLQKLYLKAERVVKGDSKKLTL